MNLPPTPASNSSAAQKARAQARYLSVKHLSDAAAAAVLGVSPGQVTNYRRNYPETRGKMAVLASQVSMDLPKPQTPSGGPEKRVYAFVAADGRINRVSIRQEPWG